MPIEASALINDFKGFANREAWDYEDNVLLGILQGAIDYVCKVINFDGDELPADVREGAVFRLAAHWCDNRNAVEDANLRTVPLGFESIIWANKQRYI